MKNSLRLLACAVALPICPILAADYLGASAVLEQAAAAVGSQGSENKTSLRAAIGAFGREAASLDPTTAAKKWLALVDRLATSTSDRGGERDVEFSDLVKVLPPPAAWPALRENASPPADASGKQRYVRLLAAWFADRLLGDPSALLADLDAIGTLEKPTMSGAAQWFQSNLDSLANPTLDIITDPAKKLAFVRELLEASIAAAKQSRKNGNDDFSPLSFPEVALMFDKKNASELITLALRNYPAPIRFDSGTPTSKFATKLALENIDSLASAQWNLTTSMDGGELYRRLLMRFGPAPTESEFIEARMFAFYRAILAREAEGAFKIAQQCGTDFDPDSRALADLVDAGAGKEICDVLHRLLEANNNLDDWSTYIALATRTGDTEPMMALLDATLAKKDLGGELRTNLEGERIDALLATGRAEEAVALLRNEVTAQSGEANPNRSSKSLEIARLGAALDRKDWLDEGITGAQAELASLLKNPNGLSSAEGIASTLSNLLLDAGRGADAEAVWAKVLGACTAAQTPTPEGYEVASDTTPDVLRGLAGVYAAAGRNDDILVLADRAASWGAYDLAEIYTESCGMGLSRSQPLGVIIARALANTGRPDEAKKMLDAMMPALIATDSAYALLVELRGQDAIPVLDRLAAMDAFQERPLIWKAKLLLDAGKLDEAEALARKAISIDPSDGEQGPGDRMRVYAVLADILEKKGNAKDAEFFRNVVKSIRMSEHADTYYHLGLLDRAITLYKEALGLFSDAYCIQSRLALRLVEAGDWKGAEEHYRRAYELMPDSFGRVESHCFGCERAFAGKPQQSIAERVFLKLSEEQPNKPQVHYLLGYLYDEQGRVADATREYQKAVALDPDYLNAWKKLSTTPTAALTPAEHTRVAENLIRLDPAGRHGSSNLDGVGDLASVWTKLAAAQASGPKPPEQLLPLPATAKLLDSMRNASPELSAQLRRYAERSSEGEDRSPGAIFSTQDFSRGLRYWLSMTRAF
jgi:tetratricopeptide (TPR) repeat protein